MRLLRSPLPFAVAALVALSGVAPASAAVVTRDIVQLANGMCDANNPANEQYLRRLPTGLRNGGANTVSVVCAQWGDRYNAAAAKYVRVDFKSDKSVPTTITCTLTMGTPLFGQVTSTKSEYLAAGGETAIVWNTEDYGVDPSAQWVNLQCGIPQAVSMREVFYRFDQDVGM
jgi:hypothetical protein